MYPPLVTLRNELLALIAAIDTATGDLPIGGTANQYLTKINSTDYNTQWTTLTAAKVTDSTATGRSVLTATDAAAARTAIGAGTSNLAVGTLVTDAKAGNYQPTAANISDSTTVGRAVLTAVDAAAARTATGAGTSSLVIGTGAGDAKAGNYQPTAANISDSTATGRSVLTATDAAAARTAIGAGTSSLVIGTLVTEAKAGNYQPASTNISDSTATGRSVLTATDAAAARSAIGAGTSSYAAPALGTNFSNREVATGGTASRAFTIANNMQWVQVKIPVATTLTGFRYRKGTGTSAANVIGALYDSAGTRVAVSGTVAQGTSASAVITIPFSGTYAAAAGVYWIGLIGSSTNADFAGYNNNTEYLGPSTGATQGSFATPSSFSPPADNTLTSQTTIPFVVLY